MSYSFDITAEPIPDNEKEAWKELERLRESEDNSGHQYGDPPGPHFLPLYERLVAKYPCITTSEGENGPWASGPLLNDFGEKHAILAISYSYIEEALPFIVRTATEMGFTVFDPQNKAVHRPIGWKPAAQGVTSLEDRRPWWKLW